MRLIAANESDSIITLEKPCILTNLIPIRIAINLASVIEPEPKFEAYPRMKLPAWFLRIPPAAATFPHRMTKPTQFNLTKLLGGAIHEIELLSLAKDPEMLGKILSE